MAPSWYLWLCKTGAMQTLSGQELAMDEERIRKGRGEALLCLSPVLCSLCLLPVEYLGKFKIYTLAAGSRTPKESLHLQNNPQTLLLFATIKLVLTKGRLLSNRVLTRTDQCWTDSRKEPKPSPWLIHVYWTPASLWKENYTFFILGKEVDK